MSDHDFDATIRAQLQQAYPPDLQATAQLRDLRSRLPRAHRRRRVQRAGVAAGMTGIVAATFGLVLMQGNVVNLWDANQDQNVAAGPNPSSLQSAAPGIEDRADRNLGALPAVSAPDHNNTPNDDRGVSTKTIPSATSTSTPSQTSTSTSSGSIQDPGGQDKEPNRTTTPSTEARPTTGDPTPTTRVALGGGDDGDQTIIYAPVPPLITVTTACGELDISYDGESQIMLAGHRLSSGQEVDLKSDHPEQIEVGIEGAEEHCEVTIRLVGSELHVIEDSEAGET